MKCCERNSVKRASDLQASTPSGRGAFFVVMTNVDALYQKQNIFGYVRGVIRDAFEVAHPCQQAERLRYLSRVVHHEAGQFVVTGGSEIINGVIRSQYAAGQICIATDEGVERFTHHALRESCDVGDIDQRTDDRFLQ